MGSSAAGRPSSTDRPRFTPALRPGETDRGPGLCFVCRAGQLLVRPARLEQAVTDIPVAAAPEDLGLPLTRRLFLGHLEGRPCWAAEAAEASAPAGLEFRGLRSLLTELPEELFALAGRATQILDWDRDHRYCGRCGGPMEEQSADRSKRCPACSLVSYPRISPAVIVAITRGDRLLLAANRRHAGAMYSVLAGFVEPGESLEECVRREIREEVGLEVTDVRYFGSQSWPFPNSLMVAFTAAHAAGEIAVDPEELVDARWFAPGELPPIPGCGTISRRLIDGFVESASR